MSGKNREDRPVYMIGVAAQLAGMHPQTLRIYERKKLVRPGRTAKSTRLYSQKDIDCLKYIQDLTQTEGVNLAGVKIIMELQKRLEDLQRTVEGMEKRVTENERRLAEERAAPTRRYAYELVVLPKGELVKAR
jgi:MerR family transcriptional regulator, heat shock protein HspR